jgi:hypothetical protein
MKHPARIAFALALVLLLAPLAPHAAAQVSRLDKNTLIDGLRQEGMGDLLKRLAESGELKGDDDPTLGQSVLIAQHMLEYTQKGAEAGKESDPQKAAQLRREALDAFNAALAERRKVIADFPDYVQRPIFQTQLAEQILFDGLINTDYAAEFYDVGVPTEAQREVFERLVPEALVALTDANLRFFHLQGELPKRADFKEKFENPGLWNRMINDFMKLRTKLFLGYAAYYTALLPDSNPYFQNVGKDPVIGAVQKKTAAEERRRLLALASEQLADFIADPGDPFEIKRASKALDARALVQAGKLAEAGPLLDGLLGGPDKQNDLIDLVATCKRAVMLDAGKQTDAALNLLHDRANRPPAVNDDKALLFRLLLVDQEHKILLAHAQAAPADKRMAEMDKAYQPYLALLADRALGDARESLKTYIYKRWEANIAPGADLAPLPPVVVGAMGEMARLAGRDLLAENKPKEAEAKFNRSLDICNQLLTRKNLPPAVEAQAMYDKAVSTFTLNQNNDPKKLEVALILIDMADRFPEQPLSEQSIGDAVLLVASMFEAENHPANTGEVYDRAMKVLLTKYGTSKAADNQRLPYAEWVLQPQGRWAEVAEVTEGVPQTHKDYFPARRLRVFALQQVYQAAVAAKTAGAGTQPAAAVDPAKVAEQTVREAAQLMRDADAALPGTTDPQEKKRVLQAAGWARLVLFDMAVEVDKDIPKALEYFRGFDRMFAGDRELIALMLQRRISAYLDINKIEDAVTEAGMMMDNFPDAAAPVVDKVIAELDKQMDKLRREEAAADVDRVRQEKAAQLKSRADAAVKLSQMLLTWAKDPKKKFTPEQVLPSQLTYVKALLMAGRAKDALDIVNPLVERFPKNAHGLLYKAEAIFALGDKDQLLKEAVPILNKITRDIRPTKGVFPPIWWNAMLRRLQINLILGERVEDVPARIQALRINDPNLGGELFKNDFEKLDADAKRWLEEHPQTK